MQKTIEVGVGIGIGIGIGIERTCMGFGHERLDVYHAAIDYVGWSYHFCEELRFTRKQMITAFPGTIPIPIATPTPTAGNER